MSNSVTFWFVSAPSNNGSMWTTLQDNTGSLSHNSKLSIPKLRAGTLDSLMTLSDDLIKHDHVVEAAVRKIERQMADFHETEFSVQVERKNGKCASASVRCVDKGLTVLPDAILYASEHN